jgi:hypothetical protein
MEEKVEAGAYAFAMFGLLIVAGSIIYNNLAPHLGLPTIPVGLTPLP